MLKNILANFIGKFWSIFSNFIFIPLYINLLGFENYSIISFTLILAGLLVILDSGLTATLSREFARKDTTYEAKKNVLQTTETIYVVLCGISLFLIVFFSKQIGRIWLNQNIYSDNDISLFLRLISFDLVFQLLFKFYLGGLLGLQKQITANKLQIAWGFFRNGLVILLIYFIPRLDLFFLWQSAATIFFTIFVRIILGKSLTYKMVYFNFTIKKKVLLNIWRFTGGVLLISLVAALNTQIDKLFISKLLPIENLGFYNISVSLSAGIYILVIPISNALQPYFTSLYSAHKRKDAENLYYRISRYINIIVFSLASILFFFPDRVILTWTGNMDLVQQTKSIIPMIAIAYSMLSLQLIPYNIAIANGYTKLNNITGIISLFVTIPGYWIVTKQYGIIGTASLFCFVQIIITIIYLVLLNKKFLDIKRIDLYLKNILKSIIISFLTAYLIKFIPIWETGNRLYLLLIIIISLMFIIAFNVITQFSKDEINNTRIILYKFLLNKPND